MYVIRKFITHTLHLIFGDIKEDVMGRTSSKHVNGGKYVENCIRKLQGRDHLRDLGVNGRLLIK
jgi:hypothetical protein